MQITIKEAVKTTTAENNNNEAAMLRAKLELLEQTLQKSETKFNNIFSQSKIPLFIADNKSRFIEVNQAMATMLGYTVEELLAMRLPDIINNSDTFNRLQEELKRKGFLYDYELTISTKNDHTIDCAIIANITYDISGAITGFHGSIINVSSQKKVESALQESEARFRALIDHAEDGIMVHDLDGNILLANDQETRFFGYSKEELVSFKMSDLLPADKLQDHKEKHWDNLEHGKSDLFETMVMNKNGTICPTEVRLCKMDFNGKPAILAVTRDITRRIQAAEALRDSEKKYRTLFENLREGVVISDRNGKIVFANDVFAGIIGYTVEEIIGKTSLDFAADGYREIIKRHIVAQRNGIVGHYQSNYKHKDGHTVYTAVNAGPMFSDDGEYEGNIICYSDISYRVKAEQERELLLKDIQEVNKKLEQSNKELQDFAYIASHDLREPMRKISSFGLLLKESLENTLDEDQQENFDFMVDAANRMQLMIDDLLSYSRLTTKAKPFTHIDLNEIISKLNKVDLAERLAETKGNIVVPKPLPPIHGDPTQIHQLLLNLVNNGLKFHRPDVPPVVTIRAAIADTNTVKVEVSDNGIGIAEQYHQQIFAMFKRLHSRSEYDGTGIGLAACSKIVSRHGGEITVSSTPGEGATFIFALPKGSYIEE